MVRQITRTTAIRLKKQVDKLVPKGDIPLQGEALAKWEEARANYLDCCIKNGVEVNRSGEVTNLMHHDSFTRELDGLKKDIANRATRKRRERRKAKKRKLK